MEELSGPGFTGIGYTLHSEIVAPYILHYGTQAQKAHYLPRMASGEMVGAIAMSEPRCGQRLARRKNHRHRAKRWQLPTQWQQNLYHQRLAC